MRGVFVFPPFVFGERPAMAMGRDLGSASWASSQNSKSAPRLTRLRADAAEASRNMVLPTEATENRQRRSRK